jgi:hypothetical protein
VRAIVHRLYADFKRDFSIDVRLQTPDVDPWHPDDMRKGFLVVFVALVLAGGAAAAPRPALRLLSETDPMIVKGTGFRAKERVTVTLKVVTPAATWRRTVVATRTGTFRAVMGSEQLGRCGFNVRATGSRGSVATLKSPPLPACMP